MKIKKLSIMTLASLFFANCWAGTIFKNNTKGQIIIKEITINGEEIQTLKNLDPNAIYELGDYDRERFIRITGTKEGTVQIKSDYPSEKWGVTVNSFNPGILWKSNPKTFNCNCLELKTKAGSWTIEIQTRVKIVGGGGWHEDCGSCF